MKDSRTFHEIFGIYVEKPYQLGVLRAKQRNYEWRRIEILQLLNDISELAETHDPLGYFVNTVAIFENVKENVEEIIDGNQRLTTTLLIYLTIKNFILNNNLGKQYEFILNDIDRRIYRHYDKRVILNPMPVDKPIFEDVLNNCHEKIHSNNYEYKTTRIAKAYKFIYEYFTNCCIEKGYNYINSFYMGGLYNLRTLILEPQSEKEAANLFQKSNTCGLELNNNTKITVFVNQILADYVDDNDLPLEKYVEYNTKFANAVDSVKDFKKSFVYFLYYLDNTYVTYTRIYDSFYNYLNNVLVYGKQKSDKFSNIFELIDKFCYFTNFIYSLQNNYFENETKKINYLLSLCGTCVYTEIAIIDMFSDKYDYAFSNTEKYNIIEMLMIITFRSKYLVSGLSHPEKRMACLINKCLEINSKTNERIDKIFKEYIINSGLLEEMGYVSDETFVRGIIYKPIYNKRITSVLKYVLTKLNNYFGDEQIIFGTNIDNTIEHVIPQINNQNEKLLHTIGNLTVLSRSNNSSLKNETYVNKKSTLNKSSIHLNQYFIDKDDFNWTDVEERSKYLAPIMCEIFKI